jgi:enamine deaminase RidA (YjgF/YER057c/UK114 family)
MIILQPPTWARPKGYANGIMASGKMIFIAGVIGWNEKEEFQNEDIVDQFRQCILNILAILKEADAGPEHMVRMTWYVKNIEEYRARIAEIGGVYKELIGKNFPVMSCIGVSDLVEKKAQLEIEVTAVLSENK